jgi:hypothetical protein
VIYESIISYFLVFLKVSVVSATATSRGS